MNKLQEQNEIPPCAEEAVLAKTTDLSLLKQTVSGYNWNQGINYNAILKSYVNTGFQATNFGLAIEEINKMIDLRNQPKTEVHYEDPDDTFINIKNNCTIFLGYTSNIVSSGLRETIRFLVQNHMVYVI